MYHHTIGMHYHNRRHVPSHHRHVPSHPASPSVCHHYDCCCCFLSPSYVCVGCIRMFICVRAHTCVHVETRDWYLKYFSTLPSPYSSWDPELTAVVGFLAPLSLNSKAEIIDKLQLQAGCHIHLASSGSLGSKLWSSSLRDKHFNPWAISPALFLTFGKCTY